MTDLTEAQRERLHHVLLEHWADRQRNAKRGIAGPGLHLRDDQLGALLRITRARPVETDTPRTTDLQLHRLIAACRAYHDALDMAFAELIEATRGVDKPPFMPSKSPMWPAMVEGKAVVDAVEQSLQRPAV